MVVVSFATSDECAHAAGMPTQDSNSFPNTTMIDDYRRQAKSKIVGIIGSGTADIDDTAWDVEVDLVATKIKSILDGSSYVIQLTQDHKDRLWSTFDCRPGGSFEISQDS